MTDQNLTASAAAAIITLQDVEDFVWTLRRHMQRKDFRAALKAVREAADRNDSWKDTNLIPFKGADYSLAKAAALRALADRFSR
jgi:hypothetical protein